MCGIAVLLDCPSSTPISDLTQAMRHRGPDDEGSFDHEGRLFLGHRRLSIVDLTSAGHQPLASKDGRYLITYNGEIYNYRELRDELKTQGYEFFSASDTEVILAAYDRWGKEMLGRFVGMFAFALLDRRENTLLVARDFFGIKPLFYWQGARGAAFASEIKALLKIPEVSREADPQRLFDYLTSGVTDYGGETFYREIRQLPAGHLLEIDLNRLELPLQPERYWSPENAIDPEASRLSFEQAAEKLRHLFLESIGLHLRSDVPVGAALSGGIDSSAIFMAMRHLQGPELELHAFSFIPEDPALSEEKWIDLVVGAAKARSHQVQPTSAELFSDIDALIHSQDEPFGSTSIYAQRRVFRLAHEAGVKVLLDGQGADELLGGYTPYWARMASLVRSGDWLGALRFAHAIRKSSPGVMSLKGTLLRLGHAILPDSLHGAARAAAGIPVMEDWLNARWFEDRAVTLRSVVGRTRGRSALKESLMGSLKVHSLPALLRYEDRNSMASSVESRVPFLTPKLMGFIYGLPEEYLIDGTGLTKAVFRRAMRGIVPDAILDRRDKVGFSTPELRWMTQNREYVSRVLGGESARRIPALRVDLVCRRWEEILSGRAAFSSCVWRWVNLVRWTELNGVGFG